MEIMKIYKEKWIYKGWFIFAKNRFYVMSAHIWLNFQIIDVQILYRHVPNSTFLRRQRDCTFSVSEPYVGFWCSIGLIFLSLCWEEVSSRPSWSQTHCLTPSLKLWDLYITTFKVARLEALTNNLVYFFNCIQPKLMH